MVATAEARKIVPGGETRMRPGDSVRVGRYEIRLVEVRGSKVRLRVVERSDASGPNAEIVSD
jgi:hypothetical protein